MFATIDNKTVSQVCMNSKEFEIGKEKLGSVDVISYYYCVFILKFTRTFSMSLLHLKLNLIYIFHVISCYSCDSFKERKIEM